MMLTDDVASTRYTFYLIVRRIVPDSKFRLFYPVQIVRFPEKQQDYRLNISALHRNIKNIECTLLYFLSQQNDPTLKFKIADLQTFSGRPRLLRQEFLRSSGAYKSQKIFDIAAFNSKTRNTREITVITMAFP